MNTSLLMMPLMNFEVFMLAPKPTTAILFPYSRAFVSMESRSQSVMGISRM